MIAADTSSMIAFLEGETGDDVEVVQSALDHQQLALPPVVLTELLSDPAISRSIRSLLAGLPMLQLEPGFWERAAALRSSLLKQKKQARTADALIAQSCLDQSTPLVTRDKDFRHFAAAVGLPLLLVAILFFPRAAAAQARAGSQQQAVIDLEQHWLASEDDPAALESILADDFIHVLASGAITKSEQLSYMRSHPAARARAKQFQDLRVRIYGTAAIANGIVVATMEDGSVQKTLFTDVFAYRHGRWQAVNAQESPFNGSTR